MKFWFKVKVFFQVIWSLLYEDLPDHLPKCIRSRMCWFFKHKYQTIFFKSDIEGVNVGIADTEAGCVFCGHTKDNTYPINANNIDWELTSHRTSPPKNNVHYFRM